MVRKSESLSRPFIAKASITIFRGMDKLASPATLRLGPAPGLVAQVHTARRPLGGEERALVLWLHGGSFTTGSMESSRARSEMLAEAGADVVSLA